MHHSSAAQSGVCLWTHETVCSYVRRANRGVWFDPLPEAIASLETEDLRKLQFSQRKAEYVIDVSKRIVSGSLSLEELHDLTDLEVEERLLPIRGIGPWTVQNVLMNGLGRPNLFPMADIGIQNAIKRHFDLPAKPTKEEMAALSKDWTPYLSYASLYLWRSIETDKWKGFSLFVQVMVY